MSQRELTLHPETGALVEVVHSYQGVELDQLNQDVAAHEAAVAEVQVRKQAKLDELEAVNSEQTQAEQALEDSKSTAARATELVGQSAVGVDAGADGASGEVSPPVEDGQNF